MVLGDLTQNGSGCEFHSFEFKPPIPLPEIDCDDLVNEECSCYKGDESKQSFKCGNEVYVCPGVDKVCSTTGSQNSLYYSITLEQCIAMKGVEIGEKCVALPQFGIDKPKGLSNRVCYTGQGSGLHGMKEDRSCDVCNGSFTPEWESESEEDGCKPIKYKNGVTDEYCRQCGPPNYATEWPCNTNPPSCQGNCERPVDMMKCTAKVNNNGVTDGSCETCDVNANYVSTSWPCNLNPPLCQGACSLF